MVAAVKLPSIPDYIAANPNAPPDEMLRVVVAETERLKEENAWIQQEYRQTTEVELDDSLNFKPKTMAQLQRLARMYAESGLVPDHYKNNVAGCAIGIQMALRMHVDILTFLQCSFVHKGKIGIEAKLAMARLNTSGKIKGRVTYKLDRGPDGKVKSCTATAEDADSGEIFSQTVDWDMVVAEGWNNSNGSQKSKWMTLPDLMFQYRAGIFLARIHYPDVLLGMYTIDELEDMARSGDSGQPASGAPVNALAELSERMGASLQPKKTADRKAPEKSHDDDPFAPSERESGISKPSAKSEERRTEPQPEVTKPAAKATPKPPAVKETVTNPEPPTPTTTAPRPNEATLRGYINTTYSDRELADFDVTKIVESLVGNKDFTRIIESIISREHPQCAAYLKAELRGDEQETVEDSDEIVPDDEVSQEAGDESDETAAVDQDGPEFLPPRAAVRPKLMDLVPATFEKKIIGKRSPDELRKFVATDIKGNPDLVDDEIAYLTHLAQRRAYQLEHNIPTTDRLPK